METLTPRVLDPETDQAELITAIKDLAAEFEFVDVDRSPNEKWEAIQVSKDYITFDSTFYSFDQLVVSSTTGEGSLTVYERVDYACDLCGLYPVAISWSADSQRLYYGLERFVDGAGVYDFYTGFYSLDVQNEKTADLAPGIFGDVSISPDENYAAYLDFRFPIGEEREIWIYLLSLNNNSVSSARLDSDCAEQAGGFAWSPDVSQLAFTVVNGGWCTNGTDASHIYLVDIETFEVMQLYNSSELRLLTLGHRPPPEAEAGWDGRGILAHSEGEVWIIDPETGEATPVQ